MDEGRRFKASRNGHSTSFDDRVVAYAKWVIAKRWYIIVGTILVAGLIASGARFLTFSNDYRDFFSAENPQLAAFEALQNTYVKADNILIVVRPKSGEVFTARTLDAVRQITAAAWKIPYATRVDSISRGPGGSRALFRW